MQTPLFNDDARGVCPACVDVCALAGYGREHAYAVPRRGRRNCADGGDARHGRVNECASWTGGYVHARAAP